MGDWISMVLGIVVGGLLKVARKTGFVYWF